MVIESPEGPLNLPVYSGIILQWMRLTYLVTNPLFHDSCEKGYQYGVYCRAPIWLKYPTTTF